MGKRSSKSKSSVQPSGSMTPPSLTAEVPSMLLPSAPRLPIQEPPSRRTETAGKPRLAAIPDEFSPGTILAFTLACLFLIQALHVNMGFYAPKAIALLTGTLVLSLVATWIPDGNRLRKNASDWILLALGAGLLLQFAQLLITNPGVYLRVASGETWPYVWGLAGMGILAGGCLSVKPWLGRFQFPLLLAIHFYLGVWVIQASPSPHIDVWTMLQECSRAFLDGVNPYSLTHENIYGANTALYRPEVLVNGRVQFGMPYPPLNLFMALPGFLLGGDYRYALLACITITAACIAYSRGGRIALGIALSFLFMPRLFFVLEQGWTEPFPLSMLALTIFCACRRPKLVYLPLGLFFALKQYLVVAVPIVILLSPRPFDWRQTAHLLGKAILVAVLVTLPLALWNPSGFLHDVILLHSQHFRADSLSYNAWLFALNGMKVTGWVAALSAGLAALLILKRFPRSPAGFGLGVGFILCSLFAFASQSFPNYYFLILGALCLGVAAVPQQTET